MRAILYSPAAYRLLQQGSIALAQVEHNGIKIDVPYLDGAIAAQQARVERRQARLAESRVFKIWRDHFRARTNFNSNEQLGHVLFKLLGHACPERTETGRYKTDEDTLARVDDPFARRYVAIKKIQKGVQVLKGIRAEVCDGYLHPVFNLHIVRTYRSSSDSPNFQNFPVRNEALRQLIRRSFVARKGRRLVEIDYSGIEVRVSACYHRDPRMISYIEDPATDMHRDMAMECFLLEKEEVTKMSRYCAKNQFVFPQFYGAWWLDCAASLWRHISSLKLETVSGMPLKEHLAERGIKALGRQTREDPHARPGTFGAHIQAVEKRFWGKRFRVYAQWKKDTYEEYLRRGWIKMLTGFVCQGQMARNDVLNYGTQGAAFHCLLQSLTWLVLEELRRARMKTLIVGQIHDSIVADVPDEELADYVALARRVMVERLRAAWRWLIVPLDVEAEVTPVGGSWVEKETYKIT